MIAIQGWNCFDRNCVVFSTTGAMVISVVSGFLAVLFGLFVAIMFFDQMQCIMENTSTIDEMKKRSGMVNRDEEIKGENAEGRSAWENLKEVFGGADKPFSFWWFMPIANERDLIVEREFD